METKTTSAPTNISEPALLSVEATSERLSLPRTAIYTLMMSGRLVSIKVGRHRLVPSWAIEQFVRRTAEEQRVGMFGEHEQYAQPPVSRSGPNGTSR